MQEAQNTQVVRTAYAAFLRGHVQGVLGALDDDAAWKPANGPNLPERAASCMLQRQCQSNSRCGVAWSGPTRPARMSALK